MFGLPFNFASYQNGIGNSGFGLVHGPGVDLRPELPLTTPNLVGVDLTHTIYANEVAALTAVKSGANASAGGGGSGSGSYADFTTTASSYNITVHFNGSNWTSAEHQSFVDAANRVAQLIVGDVPNVTVVGLKGAPRVVDDIYFTAELKAIDGLGGILGQSGPTSVRTATYLPATASMQFDSADAQHYVDTNQFGVIVLHEMLHGVGFGSIWSYLNLVSANTFVGANAEREYGVLLGTGTATPVPLEDTGGSGTAGSHWLESTFKNELMTGYINALPDPLSKMTVASLQDLGYTVNYNGPIDSFLLA